MIVVALDDRGSAFLHACAANGALACVTRPERVLHKGLLLLVDFLQVASFLEAGHVACHDPRLVVFARLKVEVRLVEVSGRHLALLVEETELRDVVLVSIHVVGPRGNGANVGGVVAEDVSREVHGLIAVLLRKQKRRLVEQLLLGQQVLLLDRLDVRGQCVLDFLDVVVAAGVCGVEVLHLRSRRLEDAGDLVLHSHLVADSVDAGEHKVVLTLGLSELLPELLDFEHLLLLVLNQKLAFGLPEVLVCSLAVVVP